MIGDFFHWLADFATTWLPLAFFGVIVLMVWLLLRTSAMMPRTRPKHLDSRGAQYVQMRLQREHFQSRPVVILNRNSQAYSDRPESETTSYIVQVFEPDEPPPAAWPTEGGEAAWFFAGDTFFGRRVATRLAQPERAAAVREEILRITQGQPLALNLEGVLVPSGSERVEDPRPVLLMESDATLATTAMISAASGLTRCSSALAIWRSRAANRSRSR